MGVGKVHDPIADSSIVYSLSVHALKGGQAGYKQSVKTCSDSHVLDLLVAAYSEYIYI